MRKFNAENERLKSRYERYLREAKGQDEKSIDKTRAALVRFEETTNYKAFKKFHVDQARSFKNALGKAKNSTGKPLSLTTTDAALRLVKGFFHWLAGQQGFKKVLSYSDVEYFNNNRNDARAAHAQRSIPFPSMQSCAHAFQAMPEQTEIQRRDKAMFAFLMLTAARGGAVASMRLKHINLIDGTVFQNGREVKTKFSKTFVTTFFPVDKTYLEYFTSWVEYLRNDLYFGAEDALFPKPAMRLENGKFIFDRLSRDPYANTSKINAVVRTAFTNVQMQDYAPHSLRKTNVQLMIELRLTTEQEKAWSQNLGHESMKTTVSAYMPISQEHQKSLIKALAV